MLQGYFDDSGSQGQDSVVTLAGFVANSGEWSEFANDWDKLLRQHHIPLFKMHKESKRKPDEKRNDVISQFVAVIQKHLPYKVECSVSVVDFRSVIHGRFHRKSPMARLLESYYFWVFHNLIGNVCHGIWRRGYRHPFDLFFDEQLIEAEQARNFYEIGKHVAPPRCRRILPTEPIFRNDIEFRPLQAADLFAWITRKHYNREGAGWEWLIAELDKVESMQCPFLDHKTLSNQISAFYEYVLGDQSRFSEKQINRWSKFL
jgi:hypothetical protein